MLMSSETRQVSLDNIPGFWARISIRFSEVRPIEQEKKQLCKVFKKAFVGPDTQVWGGQVVSLHTQPNKNGVALGKGQVGFKSLGRFSSCTDG